MAPRASKCRRIWSCSDDTASTSRGMSTHPCRSAISGSLGTTTSTYFQISAHSLASSSTRQRGTRGASARTQRAKPSPPECGPLAIDGMPC
eukprot:scaffold22390_cov28-Tisochrysis_lutea.AAC.6